MRRLSLSPFILLAYVGISAGAAVAAPPVVVAVDTSRSLSAEDLRKVAGSVGDVMVALPAGTQAGLLRFADTPQWVERPGVTPAQVGAALAELRPEGRFTLLHDAVFEVAKALPEGGAVLLVTDGRDENSATTIEDIAAICERQGVRLYTAVAGSRRDERALRRLALLTGGEYVGAIATADAGVLAGRLSRTAAEAKALAPSRASSAKAVEEAPPAESGPPTSERAAQPAAPPARSERAGTPSSPSRLPWIIAALALLAAIGSAILFRARSAAASKAPECSRCGRPLQPGESGECASCREALLLEALARRPVAPPGSAIEAFLDTGVFPQMSLDERLEKTFVMQEIPVLEVREPGEPMRAFQLSSDHAFSVGRSPQRASLAIPDPTLSAEHFRVVPHADGFYLLDLGSTNGTLRAGERLRAARLHVGDLLHAGRAEFVFTMKQLARNGARRSVAAGA